MRTPLLSLLALALLTGCDALDTGSDQALAVRYAVEGDAAVSYLDGTDLRAAQARGSWETRIEAEPGDILSIEAVSDDGEPVEVIIEINGVTVRIERGVRVRIDVRDDDRDDGEVEVEGPVEAVDGNEVTVRGLVFVVDDRTRLLGRDNEALPLSAFPVGTYVEAEGHDSGDGTFRAKKLKLEDRDDDGDDDRDDDEDDDRGDDDEVGEVEVEGPIEAVSGTEVTVRGRVFVVDDQTRLLGRDNETLPLSAFPVGTYVEAEGYDNGDGAYRAKKLKLEDRDDDEAGEIEVEGRIDDLGDGFVTVAGTRFETDAATRWLDDDGDLLGRSAFAVGDRVEAEGHEVDGVLYAEKVKQDDD